MTDEEATKDSDELLAKNLAKTILLGLDLLVSVQKILKELRTYRGLKNENS